MSFKAMLVSTAGWGSYDPILLRSYRKNTKPGTPKEYHIGKWGGKLKRGPLAGLKMRRKHVKSFRCLQLDRDGVHLGESCVACRS